MKLTKRVVKANAIKTKRKKKTFPPKKYKRLLTKYFVKNTYARSIFFSKQNTHYDWLKKMKY